MKRISLGGKAGVGLYTLVDDEDYEFLMQFKWQVNGRYVSGGVFKNGTQTRHLMHRVIMHPKLGVEVDHIDGNQLNNQRSNLRVCSRSENCCNRKATIRNKTKLKGVSVRRDRFIAQITLRGRHFFLGYFNTKKSASLAYQAKAIELHGEFSNW